MKKHRRGSQILTLVAAAVCIRPADFSNRIEAEKYDACILKNGYTAPKVEKVDCLHETKDFIACRNRELRGESIKPIEVKVFGSSPTPGPKLNPIDGSIPTEDNSKKKEPSALPAETPSNSSENNNSDF